MFFKHPVLSIDLNDKYIKILEFTGFFIKKIKTAGIIKLPEGSIESGKVINQKIVILSLKKLSAKMNLAAQKRVSISIPDDEARINIIELKSKDSKQYKEEIEKTSEELWEQDLSELAFSYHLFKAKTKNDKTRALIVGVDREVIEEKIRLIKRAKFQIGVIDIQSIALYNMVSYNYAFTKGLDIILNLEQDRSQLIFVSNGEYQSAKILNFGEQNYMTNIIEYLNIEHEETRKIIESSLSFKKILYKKYRDIIVSTHTLLVSEISALVDDYLSSNENYRKDKKIESFYLTGDGCNSKSYLAAIQRKFSAKTYIINPLNNYSIPSNKEKQIAIEKGAYSVASGLANRSFSYIK